jgi:hypothetical protein
MRSRRRAWRMEASAYTAGVRVVLLHKAFERVFFCDGYGEGWAPLCLLLLLRLQLLLLVMLIVVVVVVIKKAHYNILTHTHTHAYAHVSA